MPICFVPDGTRGENEDEARDRLPGRAGHQPPAHQEWREPPGYLGEAVRRAKRIASRKHPDAPSKPTSTDC